jgi:hypothetical protein
MPILAHLMNSFRDKPENVATAALVHILQTSKSASDGMSRLISAFGSFPRDIRYRGQERTEAAGQPDITGRDENRNMVIVVEAKFWAGLTDNQPVEYLQLVGPAGLLLFVSPEVRLQVLWSELTRRAGVTSAGLKGPEKFAVTVNDRTMALISWRRFLAALAESAREAADRVADSDLQQLWALCEQMDTEAFVPLRLEEICDVGQAKRSLQYCELVDAIGELGKHWGCRRPRSSAGAGYYGVDLWFGELRAYLAYSATYWLRWGTSPLWLQVSFDWNDNKPFKGQERAQIKAAFSNADPTGGPLREDGDSTFSIPVRLQPGVSKEEIVEDAVRQLERVGACLAQTTGNAIRFSSPEAQP